MASFIDVMGDEEWIDSDITARTEAIVAAEVSTQEQAILSRKVLGAQLGAWELTDEEKALQASFADVCRVAHALGVAARQDLALLTSARAVEAAKSRLAMSVVEVDADPDLSAQDDSERAAAQAVIDAAGVDVLQLVDARAAVRASPDPGLDVPS